MKFARGDTVRKIAGSQWHGVVVGSYSTELTPEGYAVESWTERGSVQIYPAKALEHWNPRHSWKDLDHEETEKIWDQYFGNENPTEEELEIIRTIQTALRNKNGYGK